MCLTIRNEKDAAHKVADSDIGVYKILRVVPERLVCVTPYIEVPIPDDGKMRLPGDAYFKLPSHKICGTIESPRHTIDLDGFGEFWIVEIGFHSFLSRQLADNARRSLLFEHSMVICDAVIPKGAKYIVGEHEEVASDMLDIKLPKFPAPLNFEIDVHKI